MCHAKGMAGARKEHKQEKKQLTKELSVQSNHHKQTINDLHSYYAKQMQLQTKQIEVSLQKISRGKL